MRKPTMFCLVGFWLTTSNTQASVIAFNDLGAFQGATESLSLDDFESDPWSPANVPLPQPVVSMGVSWSGVEDIGVNTNIPAHSGSQAIVSRDVIPPDATDELFAELPAGITAVGGWVVNGGAGNDVELVAYDAQGMVLGTVVADLAQIGGNEYRFIGLTATEEIDRIAFRSLQPTIPGDDFGLDDFYFGVVPEPSSFLLGAVGVMWLSGRRLHRS